MNNDDKVLLTRREFALAAGAAAAMTLGPGVQASHRTIPAPRWGNWVHWGDQGNGTYCNPVLPSDYSDLDCIRVGSDFYAISSTFQYSPGVIILHSRDLVNWRILSHAVSDLTQITLELNWDRMNRYGTGIWAGAIRYYKGKFRVYFSAPHEGYFMTTATDPAGPWEPLHCVMRGAGWDDCCPFWDDNGQGYLVGTCFATGYKTWLFKLTPDGRGLIKGWQKLLDEGEGREANKLYKINGWYYHLFSQYNPHVGRYLMMQRSRHITGPYEKRQISYAQRRAHEPNQGGLVQLPDGAWYFFTHHGDGDWEGRCASLLPVTWVQGWPIVGKAGRNNIGEMVWSGRMPVAGTPVVTPQTDDHFDESKLAVQWEWNYQPRADKWSLTQRPGFLRLHAFKPLQRNNLKKAGNTLTQRVLRTSSNIVTIALDLDGMANGQLAGLCHYSSDWCTIGVRREHGLIHLEWAHNYTIMRGPELRSRKLWLRSIWGLDGKSRFSYSLDGQLFRPFGNPYQLGWGDYRGDRIGIFTYNNESEAGYVDCDFFTYHYAHATSIT